MKYPIVTLSEICLTYGSKLLFFNGNLIINKSERICLIGRNGSGKSTLLNIINGSADFDSGSRFVKPEISIALMSQDLKLSDFSSLKEYIFSGLPESKIYKAEKVIKSLSINYDLKVEKASGGELKRASLARTLAKDSDLLLLDEPTNHLDIMGIKWLENYLQNTKQAYILISHDRQFLKNLSRKTLWLDRGSFKTLATGFKEFEDWRDQTYEQEMIESKKLAQKIKQEAHWAVEGISARRKRNQGRLRMLERLRLEKRTERKMEKAAEMNFSSATRSGKLLIEANNIYKSFQSTVVIKNFSFKITKGERIAIVGPNGIGKSTLVNLVINNLAPDAGTIKHGSRIEWAIFDQYRSRLNSSQKIVNVVMNENDLKLDIKTGYIFVDGQSQHIVGYLKSFLFSENQIQGMVSDLSGGEKARLLLAIIMAKPSNFLILDEPTNDLDIETLDLLKELVANYKGTVLFVSHDRDFIDAVATKTFFMCKDGEIVVHSGGYTDYHFNDTYSLSWNEKKNVKHSLNKKISLRTKNTRTQIKEKDKQFKDLTQRMERLNFEIFKLEDFLSDSTLFSTNPNKFVKASQELESRKAKLALLEEQWISIGTFLEKMK